jgi:DNA-directed RNA polymerase specialized sigma24 family protein
MSPAPEQRDLDIEEMRTLVWDAAGGLAPRDRAVLDLHLRQGLEGAELGAALEVTAHNATVMLSRVRDRPVGRAPSS